MGVHSGIYNWLTKRRRARETVLQQQKESQDSEEAQRKREQAEEERKQASIDMVADSIRREFAESGLEGCSFFC